MIADLDPSDPSSMEAYSELAMGLARAGATVDRSGMDPAAEQQLTIAVCLLRQSAAHLNLAALAQARGIAESR